MDTSLNTSTTKFSQSFANENKSKGDDSVSARLKAAVSLSKTRTPGKSRNQALPGGDRFVPDVNTEYAKSLMSASMSQEQDELGVNDRVNSGSPGNADGQRLFKNLVDQSLHTEKQRILHYTKAPEPCQDPLFQNRFRVIFEPVGRPAVQAASTSKRVIPKRSEKTLDAPGLMDDFCTLFHNNNNNSSNIILSIVIYRFKCCRLVFFGCLGCWFDQSTVSL